MQYNDLVYKSGPTNIKDYTSDKYNKVHNQLYEDALHNYIYKYAQDLIMKKLLYNLFICMNNCITEYNDIDEIVNLPKINELKNGQVYKIFKIDEINENNLANQNYINLLLNYINSNQKYKKPINEVFNLLCTSEYQKYDYINYIIVNIISLIEDIKTNIIDNIDNNLNIHNDFSDFIIRYNNTLYILKENNNIEELFTTEISDNSVFIYEKQYKLSYHIGFNENGYFILDVDPEINITQYYDKLYYIISYINSLLLDMLLSDITDSYIHSNVIIEKPQDEYYLPSSIIIYQNIYPHKKTVVDLTPYWSNYQDHSDVNLEDLKIINQPINDSQVQKINYINGEITMYSKLHDLTYKVNKKYVDKNTEVDDNLINLNTFTNQLQNIYK